MRATVSVFALTLALALACAGTPQPPTRVMVGAELPGAGAVEVEQLLTRPLEEALVAVPGLDEIRSTSRDGEVEVELILVPEADSMQTMLEVRSALDRISPSLPEEAEVPRVWLPLPESHLVESLSGADLLSLSRQAEVRWQELQSTPGVQVQVLGEAEPTTTVSVEPQQLAAMGLGARDLHQALVEGATADPSLLVDLALGPKLRLGDVAEIRSEARQEVQVLVDGEPAVALVGSGQGLPAVDPPTTRLHLVAPTVEASEQAMARLLEATRGTHSLAVLQGRRATLSLWGQAPPLPELPGVSVRQEGASAWEVVLAGPDRRVLAELVPEARAALEASACAPQISDLSLPPQPEIRVRLDRSRVVAMGLSTPQVDQAARLCLDGDQVPVPGGSLRLELRDCDRYQIADLPVGLPDGTSVPLSTLATLELALEPSELLRVDARAATVLYADTDGACTSEALVSAVQDLSLPQGVHLSVAELP